MLFHKLPFLLFFPVVCLLYWGIKAIGGTRFSTLHLRNGLLLIASYYFYMCWKPRYALLLLLSTAVTWLAALLIGRSSVVWRRKAWLIGVVVLNLLILFFFKYYGFITDTIVKMLASFGATIDIPGLSVLLPVGISFYIFQALGYAIDVYRGDTEPEKNFFTYALFVSFFPQLVAGPIERSRNLLRQFKEDRDFDHDFAVSGFKLMLWGYFLKLCVADRASVYVDAVFNHLHDHEGYSTLIASLLFTIQIYGDFAGYTFIAIGCARILGFSLNDNFRRPYFSTSITDFWRRWHISLSSWFRDYVYIPLGGSRTTKGKTCRNLLVTFGLSGLWHGANWTFVLWGFMHGCLLCIERILGIHKKRFTSWHKVAQILLTFVLVTIGWVFFRANTVGDAFTAVRQIFNPADFTLATGKYTLIIVGISCLIVFIKEYIEEYHSDTTVPAYVPATANYVWPVFLLVCIGWLGIFGGGQFIYFQF